MTCPECGLPPVMAYESYPTLYACANHHQWKDAIEAAAFQVDQAWDAKAQAIEAECVANEAWGSIRARCEHCGRTDADEPLLIPALPGYPILCEPCAQALAGIVGADGLVEMEQRLPPSAVLHNEIMRQFCEAWNISD